MWAARGREGTLLRLRRIRGPLPETFGRFAPSSFDPPARDRKGRVTPRPASSRFRPRLVRFGVATHAKPSPCGRVESCAGEAGAAFGEGSANALKAQERQHTSREFLLDSDCDVSWNRSSRIPAHRRRPAFSPLSDLGRHRSQFSKRVAPYRNRLFSISTGRRDPRLKHQPCQEVFYTDDRKERIWCRDQARSPWRFLARLVFYPAGIVPADTSLRFRPGQIYSHGPGSAFDAGQVRIWSGAAAWAGSDALELCRSDTPRLVSHGYWRRGFPGTSASFRNVSVVPTLSLLFRATCGLVWTAKANRKKASSVRCQ